MALAEANVLPELNPETADDKEDGDEVLQPAEKSKAEQQRGSTLSSPPGTTKQLLTKKENREQIKRNMQ